MRLPFMKKYNIEEFEFSQSYLFFWDKVSPPYCTLLEGLRFCHLHLYCITNLSRVNLEEYYYLIFLLQAFLFLLLLLKSLLMLFITVEFSQKSISSLVYLYNRMIYLNT